MPTSITTINGTDVISTSRTDINNNFSSLNTNKIETSVLDTDTTLAANSDAKLATQKATKAYADSVAGANASETAKGNVEEATDAEVTAGTASGATGAKLFITPTKLLTYLTSFITTNITNFKKYIVGSLDATFAKTYFNMQLPFLLWTGSTSGALTTDFTNWLRTDGTDVIISPNNLMADFRSTGSCYLVLEGGFWTGASTLLKWNDTKTVILDWWAKLPASGTGDIGMGFFNQSGDYIAAYNNTTSDRVVFNLASTGVLYATISKNTVGATNTNISSGLTLTNWNNYRIELDLSNQALFYVNGTLKATLSGANFPNPNNTLQIGHGRSNTSLWQTTAFNLSIEMNG